MVKLRACTLEELPRVASSIIAELNRLAKRFVILKGEMGTGKTTLVNELLKQMDIVDHTSSPTFSIVNEYFSVNYGLVYHFDFYRIENEIEALDIGVEELFEAEAYCFVEWPERIENLLPVDVVCVTIEIEDGCRIFEVSEL